VRGYNCEGMKEKKHLQTKPQLEELLEEDLDKQRTLILHNDEVNTFDYVIETLVDVCEMDPIQAEQCTFLVHYKGKCDIKRGDFDILKPLKEALNDKGLEATID
jgi:ATP-dependent Clp protease adaptor protein ClpS